MHGTALHEPAWRAASPTLLTSASIIGAIWRIWLNPNVSQMWACCSSCVQTLRGGGNSPTVLSRLWTKVHQIRGHIGESLKIDVIWQASFQLLISCSVADIFSVEVRSRSQIAFFCPQPVGDKCPVYFGPNFSNSSHKWICVQVWLTAEIRR